MPKTKTPGGKRAAEKREADALRAPMAAPGMRIGLLGGSFNPPHAAHREISLTALKRLGLDQVWWVVSRTNPLKEGKVPPVGERVAAATEVADHPRIQVTGFEASGSPYTVDLVDTLNSRYSGVNFVWIMGADNLAEFHRWRAWPEIFAMVPIAVFDRPGYRLKAKASKAAQRFAPFYVDESDAAGLALLAPPAWTVLSHRLSGLSSTAMRIAPKKKGGKKARKKKGEGKKVASGGKAKKH